MEICRMKKSTLKNISVVIFSENIHNFVFTFVKFFLKESRWDFLTSILLQKKLKIEGERLEAFKYIFLKNWKKNGKWEFWTGS